MSAGDLWRLFGALPTVPDEGVQFPAVAIPGRGDGYLAKTPSGEATFLLRGAQSPAVKPPLRLRHIEVDYGSRCRIQEGATAPIEGEFIAIRSIDVGVPGLELFVRTVEALLTTLPAEPSPTETEMLIAAIVELFRKLAQPARRSIKGLWAELFVIDRASLPGRAVAAWHAESDEKLDFVTSTGYVEVKATEQAVRIHEFALAQLRGPRSAEGMVVSVRLRRATGGIGVLDLARRISDRLPEQSLRAKVWANLVEALGRDFAEASDVAFDERFAEANAQVVAAKNVPCIPTPLPSGVVDARVSVDFSAIPKTCCHELPEVYLSFGKE